MIVGYSEYFNETHVWNYFYKRASTMTSNTTRLSLNQIRKLKSLTNSKKFNETTEEDIKKQISEDPDLYELTDEELAEFNLYRK